MTSSKRAALAVLILALPLYGFAHHDHSKGHQAPKPRPAPNATEPKRKAAEGASVKIISPAQGRVFKGDQVPVRYKLAKGKHGHHVHAFVNGELMGMFEGEQGTLNGVKPGRHILELRVLMADHETELAARDRVEFFVE